MRSAVVLGVVLFSSMAVADKAPRPKAKPAATKPEDYEAAKHQLIWGLAAHDTEDKVVNFNTRVLGRNGFVSVNRITSPEEPRRPA